MNNKVSEKCWLLKNLSWCGCDDSFNPANNIIIQFISKNLLTTSTRNIWFCRLCKQKCVFLQNSYWNCVVRSKINELIQKNCSVYSHSAFYIFSTCSWYRFQDTTFKLHIIFNMYMRNHFFQLNILTLGMDSVHVIFIFFFFWFVSKLDIFGGRKINTFCVQIWLELWNCVWLNCWCYGCSMYSENFA